MNYVKSHPALRLIVLPLFSLLLIFSATASAKPADRNHDGLPDRWEKKFDLSLRKDQRKLDQDKDGLRNINEWRAKTSPRSSDSDRDGVSDAQEDQDGDLVDNGNEQREGTLPRDEDSDNDQLSDGVEDRDHDGLNNRFEDQTGNDPVDPDTDDDGVRDGQEHSGVISAYDPATGEMTITLSSGETLSGIADESTEIECENEDQAEDGYESDDHRGGGGREDRAASASSSDDGSSDDGSSDDGSSDDGSSDDGSSDDGNGSEDGDYNCGLGLEVGASVKEAELDPETGIFEKIKLVATLG